MSAKLLLASQDPEMLGLCFELVEGTYLLGRPPTCDLVVNHRSVSRSHARIEVGTGSVRVTDLNSSNGTFVDESRIDARHLEIGQWLRFGHVLFRLGLEESYIPEEDPNFQTPKLAGSSAAPTSTLTFPVLSPAEQRVLKEILQPGAYKQIARRLGIAKNILTTRLKQLVKDGILQLDNAGGKRSQYVLTEKGRDLIYVLLALSQWGSKWLFSSGRPSLHFVDRQDLLEIAPLEMRSRNGRILGGGDIEFLHDDKRKPKQL